MKLAMKPIAYLLTSIAAFLALTACTTTDGGSAGSSGTPVDTSVSSFEVTQKALRSKTPYTPYPLDNCAVIQKPFSEKPARHQRIYKGQEVLFCCTPCLRAFDANPEPYMPRIYAARGGN
tara:strand:- start:224 stop:583 length:360 start_codon:yes stop_codon:yes gene_type:complete